MMILPRLLLGLLLVGSLPSRSTADEEPPTLQSVRWILGNWSRTTKSATTSESWVESSQGVFSGQGTVRATGERQGRQTESLLLVEMSGEVFYLAKVKENRFPVPFKLVESSPTHAVFENRTHDFPKRLEYRLREPGTLHVTVSDAGERSFVLQFARNDDETSSGTTDQSVLPGRATEK